MTLESVGRSSDDPFISLQSWHADQGGHPGQHGDRSRQLQYIVGGHFLPMLEDEAV